MTTTLLIPGPHGLRELRAVRRSGPPGLRLHGPPEDRTRTVADRVRAAILNAGYTIPSGHIELDVPLDPSPGLDLPIALAVLLADDAHEHIRQPGLVAWGALRLDGRTDACAEPGIAGLPPGPWVARIWHPTDHVPTPEEDAVITLVDADGLRGAWTVLVGLLELERQMEEVLQPSGSL